jgi:hypothetical protein
MYHLRDTRMSEYTNECMLGAAHNHPSQGQMRKVVVCGAASYYGQWYALLLHVEEGR